MHQTTGPGNTLWLFNFKKRLIRRHSESVKVTEQEDTMPRKSTASTSSVGRTTRQSSSTSRSSSALAIQEPSTSITDDLSPFTDTSGDSAKVSLKTIENESLAINISSAETMESVDDAVLVSSVNESIINMSSSTEVSKSPAQKWNDEDDLPDIDDSYEVKVEVKPKRRQCRLVLDKLSKKEIRKWTAKKSKQVQVSVTRPTPAPFKFKDRSNPSHHRAEDLKQERRNIFKWIAPAPVAPGMFQKKGMKLCFRILGRETVKCEPLPRLRRKKRKRPKVPAKKCGEGVEGVMTSILPTKIELEAVKGNRKAREVQSFFRRKDLEALTLHQIQFSELNPVQKSTGIMSLKHLPETSPDKSSPLPMEIPLKAGSPKLTKDMMGLFSALKKNRGVLKSHKPIVPSVPLDMPAVAPSSIDSSDTSMDRSSRWTKKSRKDRPPPVPPSSSKSLETEPDTAISGIFALDPSSVAIDSPSSVSDISTPKVTSTPIEGEEKNTKKPCQELSNPLKEVAEMFDKTPKEDSSIEKIRKLDKLKEGRRERKSSSHRSDKRKIHSSGRDKVNTDKQNSSTSKGQESDGTKNCRVAGSKCSPKLTLGSTSFDELWRSKDIKTIKENKRSKTQLSQFRIPKRQKPHQHVPDRIKNIWVDASQKGPPKKKHKDKKNKKTSKHKEKPKKESEQPNREVVQYQDLSLVARDLELSTEDESFSERPPASKQPSRRGSNPELLPNNPNPSVPPKAYIFGDKVTRTATTVSTAICDRLSPRSPEAPPPKRVPPSPSSPQGGEMPKKKNRSSKAAIQQQQQDHDPKAAAPDTSLGSGSLLDYEPSSSCSVVDETANSETKKDDTQNVIEVKIEQDPGSTDSEKSQQGVKRKLNVSDYKKRKEELELSVVKELEPGGLEDSDEEISVVNIPRLTKKRRRIEDSSPDVTVIDESPMRRSPSPPSPVKKSSSHSSHESKHDSSVHKSFIEMKAERMCRSRSHGSSSSRSGDLAIDDDVILTSPEEDAPSPILSRRALSETTPQSSETDRPGGNKEIASVVNIGHRNLEENEEDPEDFLDINASYDLELEDEDEAAQSASVRQPSRIPVEPEDPEEDNSSPAASNGEEDEAAVNERLSRPSRTSNRFAELTRRGLCFQFLEFRQCLDTTCTFAHETNVDPKDIVMFFDMLRDASDRELPLSLQTKGATSRIERLAGLYNTHKKFLGSRHQVLGLMNKCLESLKLLSDNFNLRVILRTFTGDLQSFYPNPSVVPSETELPLVLGIAANIVHLSGQLLDDPSFTPEGLKFAWFVHFFMCQRGLLFKDPDTYGVLVDQLYGADAEGQYYLAVFHYLAYLPGYQITKADIERTIQKFATSSNFLAYLCPAFMVFDSDLIRKLDPHRLQSLVYQSFAALNDGSVDPHIKDDAKHVINRIKDLQLEHVIIPPGVEGAFVDPSLEVQLDEMLQTEKWWDIAEVLKKYPLEKIDLIHRYFCALLETLVENSVQLPSAFNRLTSNVFKHMGHASRYPPLYMSFFGSLATSLIIQMYDKQKPALETLYAAKQMGIPPWEHQNLVNPLSQFELCHQITPSEVVAGKCLDILLFHGQWLQVFRYLKQDIGGFVTHGNPTFQLRLRKKLVLKMLEDPKPEVIDQTMTAYIDLAKILAKIDNPGVINAIERQEIVGVLLNKIVHAALRLCPGSVVMVQTLQTFLVPFKESGVGRLDLPSIRGLVHILQSQANAIYNSFAEDYYKSGLLVRYYSTQKLEDKVIKVEANLSVFEIQLIIDKYIQDLLDQAVTKDSLTGLVYRMEQARKNNSLSSLRLENWQIKVRVIPPELQQTGLRFLDTIPTQENLVIMRVEQVLKNLIPRMELSHDRKYIKEDTLIQHLYERKIEEEGDD